MTEESISNVVEEPEIIFIDGKMVYPWQLKQRSKKV